MRRTWIFGVSVVFILMLSSCATSRTYVNERYDDWQTQVPPPSSERAYRVFLIGDAGGASFDPLEPALVLLKSHLDQAGEHAAVVFLGDNVYCCGLSDSGTVRRQRDEQRLRAQLEAVSISSPVRPTVSAASTMPDHVVSSMTMPSRSRAMRAARSGSPATMTGTPGTAGGDSLT